MDTGALRRGETARATAAAAGGNGPTDPADLERRATGARTSEADNGKDGFRRVPDFPCRWTSHPKPKADEL